MAIAEYLLNTNCLIKKYMSIPILILMESEFITTVLTQILSLKEKKSITGSHNQNTLKLKDELQKIFMNISHKRKF